MLSLEQFAPWGLLILLTPATLTPAATPSSTPTTPTVCDPPTLTLPSSIRIESGLEPLVHQALAYSPRFRAQCRILATKANLRATISVGPKLAGAQNRAITVIRRDPSGIVFAEVVIKDPAEATELLAHELEHVIEQLDGVDLTHATRTGEARQMTDGTFETARAISAGQQVQGEVLDNAPDRLLGAGARVWGVVRRSIMRR
jgi:hypothetical protein